MMSKKSKPTLTGMPKNKKIKIKNNFRGGQLILRGMRFIAINFIYKYILIIYINIYRAPMGTILIFIFYNFIFLFFVLV